MDGQLAARLAQDAAQAGIEIQAIGGQIELLLCDVPRIDPRSDMLGGHGGMNLRACDTRSSGRQACWVFSRKTPRSAASPVV